MNVFKYCFLATMRGKTLLFWNLIFPIILSTFFGLTLPNAYKTETYETIPIAVIDNEAFKEDISFRETLAAVEHLNEPMFKITYTSLEEAGDLLESKEIAGIIEKKDTFHIYVKEKGIQQTILQSFMDTYMQTDSQLTRLLQDTDRNKIMESIRADVSYIAAERQNDQELSSVFFFTIIAMCCLYGGFISLNIIQKVQANQSDLGARNAVSPFSKTKMLLISFLISYSIDFVILMIMMGYITFILSIDFGTYTGYILLCIAVGILAGNSLGTLIGVSIVKKEHTKIAILTSVTLFLSMLSGMMFIQMKYFIDTYLPVISRINPANMITDALYSLYYYGVCERYFMNLASLLVFAIFCYTLSYRMIRRKQYASI